jgi:hypothetical protein
MFQASVWCDPPQVLKMDHEHSDVGRIDPAYSLRLADAVRRECRELLTSLVAKLS